VHQKEFWWRRGGDLSLPILAAAWLDRSLAKLVGVAPARGEIAPTGTMQRERGVTIA
jgi:hypothetical protein